MKYVKECSQLIRQALDCGVGNLTETPTFRIEKNHIFAQMDDIVFEIPQDSYDGSQYMKIYLLTASEISIEVYGVTGYNDGFTDYGWKREGNWVQYIEKYFDNLPAEIKLYRENKKEREDVEKAAEEAAIQKILDVFDEKYKEL